MHFALNVISMVIQFGVSTDYDYIDTQWNVHQFDFYVVDSEAMNIVLWREGWTLYQLYYLPYFTTF